MKTLNEQRIDKHEMSGIIVIDGHVVSDSGKEGRSTYGRYRVKDPDYKPDPKEVGMHRNYRKPSSLSFSTMAELKKWLKTQPKKSASDIEAIHKKYADREKMYHESVSENMMTAADAGIPQDTQTMGPRLKTIVMHDRRRKKTGTPVLLKRFRKYIEDNGIGL